MADFTALKTAIQNAIKQNGNEEITGNLLQDVLLAIVTTLGDSSINDLITALGSEAQARSNADTALGGRIDGVIESINAINAAIGNGYVYAGIATPSSTPTTGKVFYLALTAGTYTNYGGLEVPQGINILKNNGSIWSLDSFLVIDDAPTPSSNNLVKSGGVFNDIMTNGSAFDLSAYNNGTTYADLNAALTALNALPAAYKKGGMSMKYVQTSDNKYVQYRLMTNGWSTTVTDWQGVDDVPTHGSNNLVESGGVFSAYNQIININLAEETKYNGWVNADDSKWRDDNNTETAFVEVSGSTVLHLKASNHTCTFGFLKDNIHINNELLHYATGETGIRQLSANTETDIDIPSDAAFICVYCNGWGTDYEPSEITLHKNRILSLERKTSNIEQSVEQLNNETENINEVLGSVKSYVETIDIDSYSERVNVNKPSIVVEITDFGDIKGRTELRLWWFDNDVVQGYIPVQYGRYVYLLEGENINEIQFQGTDTLQAQTSISFNVYDGNQKDILLSKFPLIGKKIAFIGDSLTSASADNYLGWCGRSAGPLGMDWINLGKSGASTEVITGKTSLVHMIQNIENNEYDYIIIQPSTVNDTTFVKGEVTNTFIHEGAENDYDVQTYAGALEFIARYAINRINKVGFVIPYKLTGGYGDTWNYKNTYNIERPDVIKEVAEKWSIPCLDLTICAGFGLTSVEMVNKYGNYIGNVQEYSESSGYAEDEQARYNNVVYKANTTIAAPAGAFDSSKWTQISSGASDHDNAHCNSDGYKLIANKMIEFIKSL